MEVVHTSTYGPIPVDVCLACRILWFQTGENEALIRGARDPELPPPTEVALSPQAALALVRADTELRRETREYGDLAPWQRFFAAFGVPVMAGAPTRRTLPIATWLLAGLVLAFSASALATNSVLALGFVPVEAFRYGGATMLSSFFLHADWEHLLGNLYFLIAFGHYLEGRVGAPLCLALLFFGAVAGAGLHAAADPDPTMPLIGASCGISGLGAFFCLSFRRTRLIVPVFGLVTAITDSGWLVLRATSAFVGWLCLQTFGVITQLGGYSNVSALGHLGGAAVGVLFYLILRRRLGLPERSPLG